MRSLEGDKLVNEEELFFAYTLSVNYTYHSKIDLSPNQIRSCRFGREKYN